MDPKSYKQIIEQYLLHVNLQIPEDYNIESLKKSIKTCFLDSLDLDLSCIDKKNLSQFKSLAFVDIDNTITDSVTQQMDLRVVKFLQLLQKEKIAKIIFNTGRPIEYLFFLCRDLKLGPLAIGSNGNAIMYPRLNYDYLRPHLNEFNDIVKSKLSQYVDIKTSHVQKADTRIHLNKLLNYLRHRKYGYQGALVNADANPDVRVSLYTGLRTNTENQLHQDIKELRNSTEQVHQVLTKLNEIEITDNLTGMLHIHSSLYNKGKTADRIIKALDFPIEKTFNIGNGKNDISHKNYVGKVYAVQDSHDSYKKIADYVSSYKSSQGTLEILRKFLTEQLNQSPTRLDQLWAQTA
jgi:HAD superfamily hydrolase (TIGR01484 family)